MKRSMLDLNERDKKNSSDGPQDYGPSSKTIAIVTAALAALFLPMMTGIPLTALVALPIFWALKPKSEEES